MRALLVLPLLLSSLHWAVCQEQQPPSDASGDPSSNSSANSGDSVKLEAIKTYMPDYPERAREKGIQGEVIVRVVVSETGQVEDAEAVSGNPLLTDAAVAAAKKFKFKPFIKNERPVKVATNLSFDFNFRSKVMKNGVANDGSATSTSKNDLPPNAKGVVPGKLIHQVAPVYPPDARRANIHGTVVISAVIGKDGRLHNPRVISGPKQLFEAALGAVEQWRYKPYTLNGEPVEVETTVQVKF